MRICRATWLCALLMLGPLVIALAMSVPAPVQSQGIDVGTLVNRLAQNAARDPYQPALTRPEAAAISYTDYLGVRVRPGREIWGSEKLGFAIHPMPLGGLHTMPISLHVVENGEIKSVPTGNGFYEHSLPADKVPSNGDLGISGFRITAPLNAPSRMDEVIVFQGASYFRALSKGQDYGLSARGLSIGTGQSSPEEFPDFRSFWIEKPGTAEKIVIHALLDSPSAAGAFRFTVRPGAPTIIDVEATIYPRHTLANVGIAPLTSMYFYSVGDGTTLARDYRPAVHDSDGLLIANGKSERLWRPLRNPSSLRASSFADTNPKGFGLMQRQRDFDQYQDLEARYHRRPSAWVVPQGDWGEGSVELFELPTDSEYHDNIVAQWKPSQPLRAGESYRFAYQLSWPDNVSDGTAGAVINWTRSGPAGLPSVSDETQRFVIDYQLTGKIDLPELPEATVSASAGTISGVTVQRNGMTGGLRVSFLFNPGPDPVADLRVTLPLRGNPAEVWTYQWTSRGQPGGAL